MDASETKITNKRVLDIVNQLSVEKIESQNRTYNSIDIKASWIMLFVSAIFAIFFVYSGTQLINLIISFFFMCSLFASVVVIRPRSFHFGVDLLGVTKKYWNKNVSELKFLHDIVSSTNSSTKNNSKLIELKSFRLKISLVMLSIGMGLAFTYYGYVYFNSLLDRCLYTI